MTSIKAEDANRAELSMLVEDFVGALTLADSSVKWTAGSIQYAVENGQTAEVLPFVLANRGARAVFDCVRQQSRWGFSARARAANTESDGMRRVLGETELQLIPDGENWHLVLRLPAGDESAPTTLIVSSPEPALGRMEALHLNEPIGGFIQQLLDRERHSNLFDLLLAPDSQLSLH